jgi:hypothetical protein
VPWPRDDEPGDRRGHQQQARDTNDIGARIAEQNAAVKFIDGAHQQRRAESKFLGRSRTEQPATGRRKGRLDAPDADALVRMCAIHQAVDAVGGGGKTHAFDPSEVVHGFDLSQQLIRLEPRTGFMACQQRRVEPGVDIVLEDENASR